MYCFTYHYCPGCACRPDHWPPPPSSCSSDFLQAPRYLGGSQLCRWVRWKWGQIGQIVTCPHCRSALLPLFPLLVSWLSTSLNSDTPSPGQSWCARTLCNMGKVMKFLFLPVSSFGSWKEHFIWPHGCDEGFLKCMVMKFDIAADIL